jgi:DNA-binding NtrC family response regulator
VSSANDGAKALALVDEAPPDLLLLDVAMPRMDGMEVLRRVIARRPTLPVVMITGYGDLAIASRALQAGAADYVTKPFDLAYLEQVVAVQVAGPDRSPAAPPVLELGPDDSVLPPELDLGRFTDR